MGFYNDIRIYDNEISSLPQFAKIEIRKLKDLTEKVQTLFGGESISYGFFFRQNENNTRYTIITRPLEEWETI